MTSGKPKTFYLPAGTEPQWKRYLELCDTKLGISGSKRISKLWLDDLAVLEGKPNSSLSFSLEQKINEKLAVEKKEQDIRGILKKKLLHNNKSALEVLFNLAIKLGSDETLSKNLSLVRQRLIEYKITPKTSFSISDRQLFIIYIDYILRRRTQEKELDEYLLTNSIPQSNQVPIAIPEEAAT